jgi:hypothetical protein
MVGFVNDLERIWQEVVVTYYYPDICLKGLTEIKKNFRTAGILTEIRTKYLLNASLERMA